MAFSSQRIFFLLLVAGTTWAERNPDVCDVVTHSCGPIAPAVPTNFEHKGEMVDLTRKKVVWNELYYDNENLLAKLVQMSNGAENHYIFNYNTEQIIQFRALHPGRPITEDPESESCVAVSMEDSPFKYVFGYRESKRNTKRSKMYNANEVLRFGGPYQYGYNGTETISERGLKANVFLGCVYEKYMDVTSAVRYFFSHSDVVPSGGTQEFVVDGKMDGTYLSIPLASEVDGTLNFFNNYTGKTETTQFKSHSSVSWFRGEPEFAVNTFKIPQWLYCKDLVGSLPIPQLPTAFSTRYEMNSYTQDKDGKITANRLLMFRNIWYSYELGLARYDFTPLPERHTDIYSMFGNYGPVKSIADFNTGVAYIVHKATGRCQRRPIAIGDFFDTSTEDMYVALGTPEELFLMQRDDMEYKGKDVSRDITCNVWNGKYFDSKMNMTLYKETYFAADGWHEEAEDQLKFSVPIRHTVISNRVEDGKLLETVTEMNFFKFKASEPPLLMYDISGCIETMEHRFFAIFLKVSDTDWLMKYGWAFRQVAQQYIADHSQVSTPLRVQRVNLLRSKGNPVITFALVERTDLKTQVPLGNKGTTLNKAVDFLFDYINSNKFIIKFTPPGVEQSQNVIASPGSLYKFDPKSSLYAPVHPPKPQKDLNLLKFTKSRLTADETTKVMKKPAPNVVKGMSGGALAGLAIGMIIIGIGLGVGIMYFYIHKYGDGRGSNQIPMHKR